MFRSVSSPGSRCLPLAVLACWSLSFPHALLAQNPPSPTPAATAPAANPASTAKPVAGAEQDAKEVSSQDTPATFKVRVNNVLVRVVVRDSHGKVVSNLKKEDFQLYDGRKLQTITAFALETPRTHIAPLTEAPEARIPGSTVDPAAKAAALPQRFVSMVFDDIHMFMQDVVFVRDSATRFFTALAPSDRVSVPPGFILSRLQYEASDMVDRATRANIVINTIDSRGLYSPDVMGDIANPPNDFVRTAGYKATYRVSAQSAQEDVLAELAD